MNQLHAVDEFSQRLHSLEIRCSVCRELYRVAKFSCVITRKIDIYIKDGIVNIFLGSDIYPILSKTPVDT